MSSKNIIIAYKLKEIPPNYNFRNNFKLLFM